ncbi:MAG: radical SAM protein, partial [Candidatus Staskawiczbacteria bacterium]|nr:radical SAM protein [Candidatus Staskawiczbacteria bacterium]
MKNEEKGGNSLSLKDCQKIADDFSFLLKKWSATGVISLTGGDPLLYPDFFELFEYLNKTMPKGIRIEILGNPELLDEQTVSRLARLNPYRYQVSVDGLEKTHDGIRHSGSFQSTLNALHLLKKHGIKTTVMFTVSNENIRELVPVIDLVAEKQVDFFDFSRFSP